MNNTQYLNETVNIYSPNKTRLLDVLVVKQIMGKNMTIIYGRSLVHNVETSYDVSDGIIIERKI